MKKAFLVNFSITTRVTADVPEDFDPQNCTMSAAEWEKIHSALTSQGVDNIMEFPYSYLYEENADIKEDKECPYKEGQHIDVETYKKERTWKEVKEKYVPFILSGISTGHSKKEIHNWLHHMFQNGELNLSEYLILEPEIDKNYNSRTTD